MSRCSFCDLTQRNMIAHVARCTSAPLKHRIGARQRSQFRTALRKGVSR